MAILTNACCFLQAVIAASTRSPGSKENAQSLASMDLWARRTSDLSQAALIALERKDAIASYSCYCDAEVRLSARAPNAAGPRRLSLAVTVVGLHGGLISIDLCNSRPYSPFTIRPFADSTSLNIFRRATSKLILLLALELEARSSRRRCNNNHLYEQKQSLGKTFLGVTKHSAI